MRLHKKQANNGQNRLILSSLVSKYQVLREKVANHKSVQILAFALFLVLILAGAFLATPYLNFEELIVYGYSGIFLINFICSATFLFPLPGEAINIAAGAVLNPLGVGVVASIGAVVGESTGYLAGLWGRKAIAEKYLERRQKAEFWLKRHGAFAIFIFALLPILIFDLIGFAAGAFKYPFWKFVLFFCLSAYSLLVVVVIFGGIKNIIDMLKELSAPRDQE